MGLARFLGELFEHGRVRLEREPDGDDLEGPEDRGILTKRERLVADEFPGAAPPFDEQAATWAARQFHHACRFVLYRDLSLDVVRRTLAAPPPDGEAAAQHYSVDLVWRFLPDLDRLTAALAPHDPLRGFVRKWGEDWPLSSVGMKQVEPQRVDDLLAHAGLRQAYIDRIVLHRDSARLRDERVRDLVHAALGAARVRDSAWCKSLLPLAASPTTAD